MSPHLSISIMLPKHELALNIKEIVTHQEETKES